MIRAGLLAGEVYFATDNSSNKVVGVAVWFPPGKSLFDSSDLSSFIQYSSNMSPGKSSERWDLMTSCRN
jgi:hypothetical protein